MGRLSGTRRSIMGAMAALVVVLPAIAAAQSASDAEQGRADGTRDGKSHVTGITWIGAGVLAAVASSHVGQAMSDVGLAAQIVAPLLVAGVGPLYAYTVYSPDPPASQLEGKSEAYTKAYVEAFEKAARWKAANRSLIGTGVSAAALVGGLYWVISTLG